MFNNTVLIVDDYEDARYMLRFLLEGHGYTVIEAVDGESAVRLAKEKLPSLIFMDYRMPVFDGFEATRQLRDCAETKHLTIVILSAYCSDKEWTDRAFDAGADLCLTKPIDMDKVENLLRSRKTVNKARL